MESVTIYLIHPKTEVFSRTARHCMGLISSNREAIFLLKLQILIVSVRKCYPSCLQSLFSLGCLLSAGLAWLQSVLQIMWQQKSMILIELCCISCLPIWCKYMLILDFIPVCIPFRLWWRNSLLPLIFMGKNEMYAIHIEICFFLFSK